MELKKANVIVGTDNCISIPFYNNEQEIAESEYISSYKSNSYFSIDVNLLNSIPVDNLVCITVTGNLWKSVLLDGAILIINMGDRFIKDGKIYVLRQENIIRVKCLSYTSSGIVLKSYNQQYKDEIHTFQEFSNFEILGRVVCVSSLL